MKTLLALAVLAGVAAARYPSACYSKEMKKDLEFMSFNIQVFGAKKAGKPEVMKKLVQIIKPVHLVLVQEIRQSPSSVKKDGYCMDKLVAELNKAVRCKDCWAYVVGERHGRSASKEQYALLYRKERVSILAHMDYKDSKDHFQRAPLVATVKDKCSRSLKETGIIALHSEPKGAFDELQALKDVYEWAIQQGPFKKTPNWVLVGDFNMDCSYVSSTKQRQIWFNNKDGWTLMIGDKADTTVAKSACAYDRFATHGDNIKGKVERVYIDRYDLDSKGKPSMTNSEAKKVSDHYPVLVRIDSTKY